RVMTACGNAVDRPPHAAHATTSHTHHAAATHHAHHAAFQDRGVSFGGIEVRLGNGVGTHASGPIGRSPPQGPLIGVGKIDQGVGAIPIEAVDHRGGCAGLCTHVEHDI